MDSIVQKILTSRIYEVAAKTPLHHAQQLSTALHCQVYLKREDLQPVFSFKIRGAYSKMVSLTKDELDRGVIAASAGNHAQGVALSARKLGTSALIVMPRTTPTIKVEAVKRYGAEVVLAGDNYSEAAEHCKSLLAKTGRIFIHPYDDPDVIAGQGTIAKEILEQQPDVTHIFVPVGGGGLIAGIATYIKHTAPHITVIGVEPEDALTLTNALTAGQRVTLPHVGIFADGVAVKQVGELTFELAQQYVNDMVSVSNDELCAALKRVFEDTRSIVEPAGALGVAGLEKYAATHTLPENAVCVAINSGANMSFERLQFVTERTMIGSGHEALLSVRLPEKPGSLEQFCHDLKQHNISEFNYRQNDPKNAYILVGVNTNSRNDAHNLARNLKKLGYEIIDLTDNELAKEHIRHMVGGKKVASHEQLIHFDFPERPGALADFLKVLGQRWNITVFHYRSGGGDIGRVLIGFAVPITQEKQFDHFLTDLEFDYMRQTTNPAYQVFL